MWETLVVSLLVIGVLLLVTRSFYRTLAGKGGCGCGTQGCSPTRDHGCCPPPIASEKAPDR